MKKIVSKLFGFATCAIVAISMTSCHHYDESSSQTTKTVDLTSSTTKTLIVNLDAALPAGAGLTYNNSSATNVSGNKYTFEDVTSGKVLTLKGGGVIQQSATVNFGQKAVVVLDLAVKTKSAGITISTTGGDQSTNDTFDASTASATMKAAEVTSHGGENFAVTLFSALKTISNPQADVVYAIAPYSLDCEPNGATFTTPVEITTNLPGADNCEVFVQSKDGAEKPESSYSGNTLTTKLTHFSVWDIILNTKITKIENSTENLASGSLTAGTNVLNYAVYAGYQTSETSLFILRAFSALFGSAATKVNKKSSVEVNAAGSYKVYQDVQNYTLVSGSRTFNVKVYGNVHCDVTTSPNTEVVVPPTPVPSHNGGSND